MPNSCSSVPGNTATQEPSATHAKHSPPRIRNPVLPVGTRNGRGTSGNRVRNRTAAGIAMT